MIIRWDSSGHNYNGYQLTFLTPAPAVPTFYLYEYKYHLTRPRFKFEYLSGITPLPAQAEKPANPEDGGIVWTPGKKASLLRQQKAEFRRKGKSQQYEVDAGIIIQIDGGTARWEKELEPETQAALALAKQILWQTEARTSKSSETSRVALSFNINLRRENVKPGHFVHESYVQLKVKPIEAGIFSRGIKQKPQEIVVRPAIEIGTQIKSHTQFLWNDNAPDYMNAMHAAISNISIEIESQNKFIPNLENQYSAEEEILLLFAHILRNLDD